MISSACSFRDKKMHQKIILTQPTTTIMSETTVLDSFYILGNSNNEVSLETEIDAPGGTCTTRVKLDDEEVIENRPGSLPRTPMATSNDIKGRTLFVITTVTNTTAGELDARVKVMISGGEEPSTEELAKKIPAHENAVFIYTCKFFI